MSNTSEDEEIANALRNVTITLKTNKNLENLIEEKNEETDNKTVNVTPEFLNIMMSYLNEDEKSKLLSIPYTKKMPKLKLTDKLTKTSKLEFFTIEELKILESKGYIIKDSFIKDISLIDNVIKEVEDMYQSGFLKQAYMSKGDNRWADKTFRGDYQAWINDKEKISLVYPNLIYVLNYIDQLRIELNRETDFNGKEVSTQVACYPGGGARYVKHLDSTKGENSRRLTCLLYLNKEWKEEDGGALRIYEDSPDSFKYEDISPICNRLLIFQSRRMEHEVLPSHKIRFSITSWFY